MLNHNSVTKVQNSITGLKLLRDERRQKITRCMGENFNYDINAV